MTGDQITDQAALAVFFTWAFQHIKQAPWASFIGDHAPGMSRALSTAFAAVVGAGFTYTWTGSAEAGWTGSIYVPPMAVLIQFGQNFLIQWFGQKGAYKIMYGIPGKPETPKPEQPEAEPNKPVSV